MARPTLPPEQRKAWVGVRLDPDALAALDRLAETLGTSRSAVLRDALTAGLPVVAEEHAAA